MKAPPIFSPPEHVANYIDEFTGRTWLLKELVDWLDEVPAVSKDRYYLMQADPGVGKSMLIAWLAGFGPTPANPVMAARLAKIRASVYGAHFFVANSDNTTGEALVESLSAQLALTVDGFSEMRDRLQQVRLSGFGWGKLSIKTEIKGDNLGNVIGVQINNGDMPETELKTYLRQMIVAPLNELERVGRLKTPILLLVDALDEADPAAVWLLGQLQGLTRAVKFLFTSRDDPNAKLYLHQVRLFDLIRDIDLIEDAPNKVHDIRQYAEEKLKLKGPAEKVQLLSAKIAQASDGIFLYARLVVADLLESINSEDAPATLDAVDVPQDLEGLYRDFLLRIVLPATEEWETIYKPLLGLIAVSQSPGLSLDLLVQIIGEDYDQAIRKAIRECRQYFAVDVSQDTYQLFHQSFRTFLLGGETPHDFSIHPVQMHRRLANHFEAAWDQICKKDRDTLHKECLPGYGINHLAFHLASASEGARLINLIDDAWMEANYVYDGHTYNSFINDVNIAWQWVVDRANADEHSVYPEHVVRLFIARQQAREKVERYSDLDLKILVRFNAVDEAMAHAQARTLSSERCSGWLAIAETLPVKAVEEKNAIIKHILNLGARIVTDSDAFLEGSEDDPPGVSGSKIQSFWLDDEKSRTRNADAVPGLLDRFADLLIREKQFNTIEEIAHLVPDGSAKVRLLLKLAAGIAPDNAVHAEELYVQLIGLVDRHISPAYRKWSIFATIVDGLAKINEFGQAFSLIGKIRGIDRVHALTHIGIAMAKNHHPLADRMFSIARSSVERQDAESAQALFVLGSSMARYGHPEAEATFVAARNAINEHSTPFFRTSEYSDLALKIETRMLQFGFIETEDYLRFTSNSISDKIEERIYQAIRTEIAKEEYASAERVAMRLSRPGRVIAFGRIASRFMRLKERVRAEAFVDKAIEAAEAIEDENARLSALLGLGQELIHANMQAGEQVLKSAMSIVDVMAARDKNDLAKLKMATAFANTGRYKEAFNLLIQLEHWVMPTLQPVLIHSRKDNALSFYASNSVSQYSSMLMYRLAGKLDDADTHVALEFFRRRSMRAQSSNHWQNTLHLLASALRKRNSHHADSLRIKLICDSIKEKALHPQTIQAEKGRAPIHVFNQIFESYTEMIPGRWEEVDVSMFMRALKVLPVPKHKAWYYALGIPIVSLLKLWLLLNRYMLNQPIGHRLTLDWSRKKMASVTGVNMLLRMRQYKKAMDRVARFSNDDIRSTMLLTMLLHMAKNNQAKAAFDAMPALMHNDFDKYEKSAHFALSAAMFDASVTPIAINWINDMRDRVTRLETLALMAFKLAEFGSIEAARMVYLEAKEQLDTALQEDFFSDDGLSGYYAYQIAYQAATGNVEKAIEGLNRLEDQHDQKVVRKALARRFLLDGSFVPAFGFLEGFQVDEIMAFLANVLTEVFQEGKDKTQPRKDFLYRSLLEGISTASWTRADWAEINRTVST